MRSALPLAALTLAAAVLLTGCVPQDPAVIPPPEQTSEPVFASDEEALAAATDAYTAYLAMSDLIGHEGGRDAERLQNVAVGDALATSLLEFKTFTEDGFKSTGDTALAAMELQNYWAGSPEGTEIVSAYACLDVSAVDVFDANGLSVVNETRQDKQLLEITFDAGGTNVLLVSLIEPWPSGTEC